MVHNICSDTVPFLQAISFHCKDVPLEVTTLWQQVIGTVRRVEHLSCI